MKTRILLLLNLMVFIGGADLASAFYDPTEGRWLSRDPNRESGFETAHRLRSRRITSVGESLSVNLFSFVKNDPLDQQDAFGLMKFALYGKYCGPGWCGGIKQSESDCAKQKTPLPAPTDAMDEACKNHDLCIGACKKPIGQCDKDMCDALSNIEPDDINPPPGKDNNYIKNIWQAMIGVFCYGKVPGH